MGAISTESYSDNRRAYAEIERVRQKYEAGDELTEHEWRVANYTFLAGGCPACGSMNRRKA